jgi:predicted RNA binding protein YcfA (HicA-like mRNA interferase family)
MSNIPAISGPQLMRLLEKDGWVVKRFANHGARLHKEFEDRAVVTVIHSKSRSLPKGTLKDILKQTRVSDENLLQLIEKHDL